MNRRSSFESFMKELSYVSNWEPEVLTCLAGGQDQRRPDTADLLGKNIRPGELPLITPLDVFEVLVIEPALAAIWVSF